MSGAPGDFAADILKEMRAQIDDVDARIVALLAERLGYVDRIVTAKQAAGLPAFLPERIEDVVKRVRDQAAHFGIPPTLIEAVWRTLIQEVIAYENHTLHKT